MEFEEEFLKTYVIDVKWSVYFDFFIIKSEEQV